jgi:hypothetical protein
MIGIFILHILSLFYYFRIIMLGGFFHNNDSFMSLFFVINPFFLVQRKMGS